MENHIGNESSLFLLKLVKFFISFDKEYLRKWFSFLLILNNLFNIIFTCEKLILENTCV